MIHVLVKVVHVLFGRITVRILWTRKGGLVSRTSSPLPALYSDSPRAASYEDVQQSG